MKSPRLLALLLCTASQVVCAGENGAWLRNGWQPYSDNFAGTADTFKNEREHWLQSRLKFSGKTTQNSDGLDGAVGVAMDSLVGKSDAIGLDYRDVKSYDKGASSNQGSFRYRFPVGTSQLWLDAGKSRYKRAASKGDRRYEATNEAQLVNLTASRPLFSRFGIAFDGVARHRERDSASFEDDTLISESRYQLSTVGLEASTRRELAAGLLANTRIQALSGRELQATDYPVQEGRTDEREFYKVAVSASVEQEVFQWSWRLNGRYQFADEDLPSAEYLAIAAPSMLAGFNGQSVTVAQGGWLRLGTASPTWPVPFVHGVLSSVNLAVLQGWIPAHGAQANRHGQASAGQVSVKMQGRAFTANVSVGRMLSASTAALTMPDHPDVRFSLSMDI